MSGIKYFAIAGQTPKHDMPADPKDARVQSVWMDGDVVENCIFGESCWYKKPFKGPGYIKHDSDELLMFVGSDSSDPENLNAEIGLWIEKPYEARTSLYKPYKHQLL